MKGSYQSEQKSSRKVSRLRRDIRHLLTGAMLLIFVLGFVVFYNTSYAQDISVRSAAQSDTQTADHTKYYKTIEITSGDTLWSIAELYMDDHYDSVKEYVRELKEMNHLNSDSIQDGQYLTIAYYL